MFDKRHDFDCDIVNFPFLDGDGPRTTCFGVYIFSAYSIFLRFTLDFCVSKIMHF